MDRDPEVWAGLALLCSGVVATLGMLVAAAAYPGYDPITQTISALGASDAPARSALTFNAAMVVSGALAVAAAAGLARADAHRAVVGTLAAAGLGVAAVGLFPTQTGLPHVLAALVAFGGGGVAAVTFGVLHARGLARGVAAAFGAATLVALVGFVGLAGDQPLGVGGLERVVSYGVQLWAVAAGGYLLATGSGD